MIFVSFASLIYFEVFTYSKHVHFLMENVFDTAVWSFYHLSWRVGSLRLWPKLYVLYTLYYYRTFEMELFSLCLWDGVSAITNSGYMQPQCLHRQRIYNTKLWPQAEWYRASLKAYWISGGFWELNISRLSVPNTRLFRRDPFSRSYHCQKGRVYLF